MPKYNSNLLHSCRGKGLALAKLSCGAVAIAAPMLASVPLTTIAEDGTRTADDTVTITVDSACSMTATIPSGKDHTATLTPGTYTPAIGETDIKTVCNDGNGHAIYAIGFSNDTEGDTDLHHTDGTNKIETGTAISGNKSAWAMQLTALDGSYKPTIDYAPSYDVIPSNYTKVAHYDGTTDKTAGSTIKTTYAVFSAPSQPAGTYTGKVRYVLVHPKDGEAPKKKLAMQNIDAAYITNMQAGVTETMVDSRDGKEYTVAKLADGKVWMTQNLALGGTEPITLTSADSNVTTDYTLAAAQTSGTTSWDCGSDDACKTSRVYATGNTEYGNYYSWYTATANTGTKSMSSGDATGSICPKGWRLPTGGDSGELKALYTAYSSNFNSFVSGSSLAFSGTYSSGVKSQGGNVYWWSSSVNGSNYAYNLGAYSYGVINPGNYDNKYRGYSVRCVAAP